MFLPGEVQSLRPLPAPVTLPNDEARQTAGFMEGAGFSDHSDPSLRHGSDGGLDFGRTLAILEGTMSTEQRRSFIGLLSDNGESREGSFVNLDLARMVDQIQPGHIRLWFSETHKVEIHGNGAATMLARFTDRALKADGSPVEEIGNTNIASPIKSQSSP